MSTSTQTNEFFDTLAKVLLRCTIFGFLLLAIWFGFFVLAGGVVYDLHGGMFHLTPHELNLIHYCGMAFVKLVVICLFLIPWAAIRLVVRKTKG